jgi:type I restriction enzyme S subunit
MTMIHTSNNNTEIPNDWEVKKFEKVAKFFSGGTPLTSRPDYYSGNIPFIKSGEIYFDATEQYISDEGLNNSSAKMVDKGDLLYALYGANSGEVAISRITGAINQAILCIRHNGDCDTVFVYNYLLQQKENIIRTYLQGGQGNLSAEIVKNLPIPLPPLPEQKAIAHVLSTADAAIHTTEKLIAQKELRKKWLMQQLLTGKKRLKGFDGEWKETAIGEMGIIQTGNTPSKLDPKNWDGKHNWCTADDMKSKYVSNTLQKLSDKGWETARIAKANSVLVTCIASIGVNAIAKVDTGFNQQINSITPSTNYNVEFIYYLILFSKNKLMEYAGAGALPMLNKNTFMSIKFKIPILEEQTAIAQVLQAADKEISLLKAKAEKLREQKKGLMQQLLTGKKRLIF